LPIGCTDVTPYIINWVQFWRIRWKRLNNDRPMRTKVVSHRPRTVNGDCIPHERDGAADPSVDLFDKPHHRISVEIGVVCEEVKMETKMCALRADRYRPDNGNAPMRLRELNHRRVATWRPGPSSYRVKHEACFIGEHDVSVSPACPLWN
jgi:hypothetical protein